MYESDALLLALAKLTATIDKLNNKLDKLETKMDSVKLSFEFGRK